MNNRVINHFSMYDTLESSDYFFLLTRKKSLNLNLYLEKLEEQGFIVTTKVKDNIIHTLTESGKEYVRQCQRLEKL